MNLNYVEDESLLKSIASKISSDKHLQQDLVQQACVSLLQDAKPHEDKIHNLKRKRIIAKQTMIRYKSHNNSTLLSIDDDEFDNQYDIPDYRINETLDIDLSIYIDRLSKIQAHVVRAYFFDNKTFEMIANERNCSKQYVHQIYTEALRSLRKMIK